MIHRNRLGPSIIMNRKACVGGPVFTGDRHLGEPGVDIVGHALRQLRPPADHAGRLTCCGFGIHITVIIVAVP
ncbi:hypothetical protein D3C81_2242400 [compost metagenome]